MKGIRSVILLAVSTLSILLVSCDNFFAPPEAKKIQQTQSVRELNRTEELALWRTTANHETPVGELQTKVQTWLQSDAEKASRSASIITGMSVIQLQ